MRTVAGYNPDGSKRWSDNEPSYARLTGVRGSQIVPGLSGAERDRIATAKKKATQKTREWRAAQKDAA